MRWKGILAVVVILLLVGVLFTTNFGKTYGDFLRKNIGKFSLPFPFFQNTGEQFSIFLTSNKNPYYGMSFDVPNGTFISKSICVTNVKVNDLYIDKSDSQCDISLYNARGNFAITRAGSIVLSSDASSVSVSGTTLYGNLHVEVELVPIEFLLTGVTKDQIALSGVDGDFKRFGTDGTIAQSNLLKNETIVIYNFAGILQLKGSEMDLQGFGTAVESSTFKIPK